MSTKIRTNPERRAAFLTPFAYWSAMNIELLPVDYSGVLSVSERYGLTAYDASYLWLAVQLGAELITLDRRLARAAAEARPTV